MMETTTEMKKSGDESSISSFTDNPFQRRIEFHLARKNSYPYSSSCNEASDFHLEKLDPSSDRQQPGMSNGGCGPSGSAGKKLDGGGDTLEHGLDPKLRFEITFRRIKYYFDFKLKRRIRRKKMGVDPIRSAFDKMKANDPTIKCIISSSLLALL